MDAYRRFSYALLWRVIGLALALAVAFYGIFDHNTSLVLLGLASVAFTFYRLYRYVNDTNRRLARFFETVRFADFSVRFSKEQFKGDAFAAVNQEFNVVLEAFRKARAEKEANLLFLNAIVQHLVSGILVFDANGQVLTSNTAAFQLLGVYRLTRWDQLPETHQPLLEFIQSLHQRGKLLYQPEPGRQLAIQGIQIMLQGRTVRLFTLQNIHTELQSKEVDAWRDLTRVLRHEMMNSVAPIVSLVETMQDIVQHDLPEHTAKNDLAEALEVVYSRSRDLMTFVQAYRTFTSIPEPQLAPVVLKKCIEQTLRLVSREMQQDAVQCTTVVTPEDLTIQSDAGQLEMVLLNLLRNAREALTQPNGPPLRKVMVTAGINTRQRPFIEISDNGPGIDPKVIHDVFIPFFTTKSTGSGIGLSVSRQIIQLHGGDLRVSSTLGQGAVFTIEF
jgi:two-component system, NtrC family, nitrogen regulation sensor histidine kinase NtrY